jgi:general secretion pathway protein G
VGEVRDALGYSLSLEDGGSPAGGGGTQSDPLASFYPLFGCLAFLAVLLVPVAVVVVIWVVLRRRRAGAAAGAGTAAASAAVCPRCGTALAPGARSCAGCGAPLQAPYSPGSRVALILGLAAAGCLVAVSVFGIIAAVLIPNFIDALGKAKQKRTMVDMLQIASDLEVYRADEGSYPATADIGELVELLTAVKYPGETPVAAEDGWKRPLHYTCTRPEEDGDGCADYRLVSAGADGELEHPDPADYETEELASSEVDRDLVVGPEGTVIQGPG